MTQRKILQIVQSSPSDEDISRPSRLPRLPPSDRNGQRSQETSALSLTATDDAKENPPNRPIFSFRRRYLASQQTPPAPTLFEDEDARLERLGCKPQLDRKSVV